MQHIIKIAKGSLIGIGLILPGISGAMIATSLYIYEELIVALNQFTKNPIRSILSIWHYLIGVLIGVLFGMYIIQAILELILVPIIFLFVGFILGGVPKMIKDVEFKKATKKHVATFIVFVAIMLSTLFLPERSAETQGFTLYIILILIGVLTAISMIIPGLSGATILLALGYYEILIDVGTEFFKALISFNFTAVWTQFPLAFFIGIGAIFGLIGIGKLVYYLIKIHPRYFYFAVLGIVLASPINIMVILNKTIDNGLQSVVLMDWIYSLISLILGIYLTQILIKKTHKKSEVILND